MKPKMSFSLFYLLFFGGFGSLYPLLTLFFNEVGYDTPNVSKIITFSLLLQLIFQPTLGLLSDKYGKTKLIVQVSLLLTSFSGLLMGFITNVELVIFYFLILSITNISISALVDTLVLGTLENNNDYGRIRAWGAIGYAICSFASSILINYLGVSFIPIIYGLLMFFAFVVSFRLPKTNMVSKLTNSKSKHDRKFVFGNKYFMYFSIGSIFIFGIHQANNTFFPTFIEKIDGNMIQIGTAFLVVYLFEGVAMFLTPFLINRYGLNNVVIIAGILVTCRWFLYSFSPQYIVVLPVLLINGLAIGLFVALAPQVISKIVGKSNYEGTFQNMYWTIANTVGTMIVAFAGGFFLDITNNIFSVYCLFGLLGLVGIEFIRKSLFKR